MANSIGLASKYTDIFDKVYKEASKTSILDAAPSQVKASANAGTFYVRSLTLVGLGDYSKTAGPPAGDTTNAWVPHTYDFDRGRKFDVDAVDDIEAMGVFGLIADEFIRRYVTPEIDATRFEVLAGAAGNTVNADLSSAANWVTALNLALNTLADAEVPDDDLLLFITATGARLVRNAAPTAATTDALDRATVIEVPQTRFYTDVTLNAGATGSAGGYTQASGAEEINFLMMDRKAAFADAKHNPTKVITPQVNQTSDSYVYHYRIYHDCFPYGNKTDGIYVHTEAAIS